MRGITRTVVGLVAVATLLAAAPTSAGQGPRPATDGLRLSREGQERALAYWTGERMRNARAATRPEPSRRSPLTGTSEEVGVRGRLVAGTEDGDTSRPAGGSPAVYDYPYPYTRYGLDSPLYGVAPYRTVGKIFFRRGGSNLVCSGASVVGGPRQIVFTAGHCLNNGNGTYSRNVVFVPAYRNGNRPFGTFAARTLWVIAAWDEEADHSYDYGAFDVGRNAAGKLLGPAVGKLGFAFDQPRDLHWSAFGYPAGSPFTGGTMHVCHASRAVDDLSDPGIGPDPIGIGCDLTGGSSGGPWIFRLKRGSYLNSVISYGYFAEPEGTYGPYSTPVRTG